jgi:hypothetical protein
VIPPYGHDADAVRRRAEELLNAPPYVDGPPGPVRRALTLLGDRVAAWLASAFANATFASLLPWILVVIGAIIVIVVVVRLTRGASLDRSVAQVPRVDRQRTAADWSGDADAAEADGRWRDAVRYRYLAVVTALHDQGHVEELPGRTVRELDREVAAQVPELAAAVARAGERFEEVVYGGRPAERGDLDAVRAALDAVTGARRAGGRGAGRGGSVHGDDGGPDDAAGADAGAAAASEIRS